jgi:hypothetical protein
MHALPLARALLPRSLLALSARCPRASAHAALLVVAPLLCRRRPLSLAAGSPALSSLAAHSPAPEQAARLRALWQGAFDVLTTATPVAKCERSRRVAAAFLSADAPEKTPQLPALAPPPPPPRPPDTPARPALPLCVAPRLVPSAKSAAVPVPIYLLHSVAHIELNAVDLTWDLLLRWGPYAPFPHAMLVDFVVVADDESRHFLALEARLRALGSFYGAVTRCARSGA